MKKNIPNRTKKVLNKLFDAAENPSQLFLSDGERMKALYKMIGAKAAGWQKPVSCMYRGCSKPSIAKSHTIQRSGPISQLLEDGHVVTPRFLDGELKIKSIGASDASTFPGFCSEHEAIFRPFETTSTISTREHVDLQAFRTICREIRRKRYDIQHQESLLADLAARLEDMGNREASRRKIEFQSVTVNGGAFGRLKEAIERGKQVIDRLENLYNLHFDAIDKQSETQLAGYVAQINIAFPVALSGIIEHHAKSGNISTWIAGVIPQGGGTLMCGLFSDRDCARKVLQLCANRIL
ncbi:hypothetical protein [Rhizobium mayense]|uniref:Uncharacterized protein n=1 Tax=Rhizobium mayense TaxID=1312184 RepID=A0ABT7K351_9HYPH|nr:hypothetical protein [Rhizobium mayense]MDL2403035.1 hypothetical protein [Rhizobium mayense]